jgi:hypothetical protein
LAIIQTIFSQKKAVRLGISKEIDNGLFFFFAQVPGTLFCSHTTARPEVLHMKYPLILTDCQAMRDGLEPLRILENPTFMAELFFIQSPVTGLKGIPLVIARQSTSETPISPNMTK